MPASNEERELGRFFRNAQSEIVFRVSVYRGKPRFDIREYVNSDSFQGFTKAGINLGFEQIDDFVAALTAAAQKAKAEEGQTG